MGACAWQERSGHFWKGRERLGENQDPQEEMAWKAQVRAWRKSLGVGTGVKPLDAMRLQIRGLPNLNDRIRALLNMVIIHHGMDGPQDHSSLKASVKGIIVDISQNPGETSFHEQGRLASHSYNVQPPGAPWQAQNRDASRNDVSAGISDCDDRA